VTDIKIRLWDKKKKVMYPPFTMDEIGYTNDDDGIHFGSGGYVGWDVDDDCEKMLWTGMTIGNDDIFQGDLVETPDSLGDSIHLVQWHFNRWVLLSIKTKNIKEFRQMDIEPFYKLVGNGFEGHESLKR